MAAVGLQLFEEIRERGVIEELSRCDALDFARLPSSRKRRRRGSMTAPAGVVHALDLPIDPELVHDLAKAFDGQIRDKRAKLLRSIQQIGFHALEDDVGVFAQGMHSV